MELNPLKKALESQLHKNTEHIPDVTSTEPKPYNIYESTETPQESSLVKNMHDNLESNPVAVYNLKLARKKELEGYLQQGQSFDPVFDEVKYNEMFAEASSYDDGSEAQKEFTKLMNQRMHAQRIGEYTTELDILVRDMEFLEKEKQEFEKRTSMQSNINLN